MVKQEKEKLNMELFHLKNVIKKLSTENQGLSNKLIQISNDNSKLQKMIEDVEEYITTKTGYHPGNNVTHQSNLVTELKKQIKTLKQQINLKENQLEAYKRNPKILKIQELQMELQTYQNQSERLKEITEQTMQEAKEINGEQLDNKADSYLQLDLIQNLQSDNAKIHAALKDLDEKNLQLSIVKDQEERECNKLADEISYLQQTLDENEQEIVELKKEIELIEAQNQELQEKAARFPNDQQYNDDQYLGSDAKIKELIEEKGIIIEQQDKQIKELQMRLQEKNDYEEKEIAKLDSELESLKGNYNDLENRYNTLQEEYNEAILKRENQLNQNSQIKTQGLLQENSIVTINNDKLSQLNKKFKKVSKVKLSDIKDYGLEINYRLKLKRITINQVEEMLLQTMNKIGTKKGYISIEEMQQILQGEPFLVDTQFNLKENFIVDPEKIICKSLLISRYLIEDNDEEFLDLDVERTEKNVRVVSVFKKFISNYALLTEEEDVILMKEVSSLITKYKGNLIPSLEYVQEKDPLSMYISMKKIWSAITYLDIGLTEEQFEYLIIKLFKDTNTLDKLEFMRMFKIFNEENANYQFNAYEQKKAKLIEQEKFANHEIPAEYQELFEEEFGDKLNQQQDQ